jgi:hypothetical protein
MGTGLWLHCFPTRPQKAAYEWGTQSWLQGIGETQIPFGNDN